MCWSLTRMMMVKVMMNGMMVMMMLMKGMMTGMLKVMMKGDDGGVMVGA